jgi:WD40 repeat protein
MEPACEHFGGTHQQVGSNVVLMVRIVAKGRKEISEKKNLKGIRLPGSPREKLLLAVANLTEETRSCLLVIGEHPKPGKRAMKRIVKVLLWVTILESGFAGLWLSGRSGVAADEPKTDVKERGTLKGHTNFVLSLAFSPDSKTLASASEDRRIKLWDVAAGKEQATLQGHTERVNFVAFSPDGKTLASASDDKTIKLWDMATGKELATLQGHTERVLSLAFRPDGKMLASVSADKTIKQWDVATGKELATLMGHKSVVLSVVFSPDGKTLASASFDKTIKLWDVKPAK